MESKIFAGQKNTNFRHLKMVGGQTNQYLEFR